MRLEVGLLEKFLRKVNYPVLIGISDCKAWCLSDCEREVKWVSPYKAIELSGYSCYLPEGFTRQDGYFIANLDTQTGCWQTGIFEESRELTEDDFWDKYEEYM